MGAFRVRIKTAHHEFEAEGEPDHVKHYFEEFKQIISRPPAAAAESAAQPHAGTQPQPPERSAGALAEESLARIVRDDGRSPLALSAVPQGERREADAALILLFAYRTMRQEEPMGGAALLRGLQVSGYNVDRVDRIMDPLIEGAEPLVMRTGQRRGVRYRLTTRGALRARQLADELLIQVS